MIAALFSKEIIMGYSCILGFFGYILASHRIQYQPYSEDPFLDAKQGHRERKGLPGFAWTKAAKANGPKFFEPKLSP